MEKLRPSFTETVEINGKSSGGPKLGTNRETLVSDDSENKFNLNESKLKYEESTTMHVTRATVGSLLFLYGFISYFFPFPVTGSIPSIILSLVILPDSWRRNVIKFIKKIPFVGKKVCPFLERLEENIEDTEVSFFKLLKKRD